VLRRLWVRKDFEVADNGQDSNSKSNARAVDDAKVEAAGGFFAIHRRGQGKWTRVGTAIASGVLIIGGGLFIYSDVRANAHWTAQTALIVASVFVLLFGGLAFWLQNKPSHVSFLIETDSEMNKVNWTTKKELVGSTKVVIGFMFLMAVSLFLVDILFGYFFYAIKVLKVSPFGQ
jgi:preprotein translocase SecE subunit